MHTHASHAHACRKAVVECTSISDAAIASTAWLATISREIASCFGRCGNGGDMLSAAVHLQMHTQ